MTFVKATASFLLFLSCVTTVPFWYSGGLGNSDRFDEFESIPLGTEATAGNGRNHTGGNHTLALRKKHLHRPQQDGLSGCLLIKDANDRLPEWIAYHYHFLPLRYLIVAVDPESKTSPSNILSRWNRSELGMQIELWQDSDYVGGRLPASPVGNTTDAVIERMKKRHQDRQRWFLARCISKIKSENRTWTYSGDIDEYLVFNRVQEGAELPEVLKHVNRSIAEAMFASRLRLPRLENSTVAALIEREKESIPWVDACFQIPRVRFGPKESTDDVLPSPFDPKAFHTVKFRHHAPPGKFITAKFVKAFIDASRVPDKVLRGRALNPHKVFPEICKFRAFSEDDHHIAPLSINHYFGEVSSFHGGNVTTFFQRSREGKYQEFMKAAKRLEENDEIRPWLKDFVDVHGEEEALWLLGKGE